MANLKDIATAAGVSIRTVSRVLNNEPHISPAKKQAVKDALTKLHYVPNLMARGLKNRRTQVIGIIADNLSLEVTTKKLDSLQTQADVHGYRVMICFTRGDDAKRMQACQEFAQFCDGIFFFSKPSQEIKTYLASEKIPFVLVDSRHPEDKNSTKIDRSSGIIEALKASYGNYTTSILLAPLKHQNDERITGFRKGTSYLHNNKTFEIDIGVDFEAGYQSAEKVLHHPHSLSICYNDFIAAGLLKGLSEKECRIPEEYGIIGFDNNSFTPCTHIALSTIGHGIDALARESMALLQQLIKGADALPIPCVPTSFIQRESTLPPQSHSVKK